MKNKLVIVIILLMCSFLVIPPMFLEDGIFDVTYILENCDGIIYTVHGKHYERVFNILVLTLLSVIFISIPYLFRTLHRPFKWISTLGASWIIAALSYQLVSVIMPESLLLEAMTEEWTSFKFASLFTIGIILIITHETWNKQMN